MLAHASRNPAPGGRRTSHVPAIANMPPATTLIGAHDVGTEDDAILLGDERLLVRPRPVAERFGFAHVRVQGVGRPFTNCRENNLEDSWAVGGFCLSDLHGARLGSCDCSRNCGGSPAATRGYPILL